MRKNCLHIILLLPVFFPLIVFAQESNSDKIIESIIESHLSNLDEGTDVGLIIEDLEELAENPININSTNESQLSRIYFLDDIQISKFLKYIEEFGPAYSIYELNTIDGFTPQLLNKIEPFIWFGPTDEKPEKLSDALKYANHQFLIRSLGTVQKPAGYLPNEEDAKAYEGNQFRYYARYRVKANQRFSAGITAEKDPGESFLAGSNKTGFDFYSGHLSFKVNSTIENITLGDFIVRSGQGLVLWQEYAFGKSENVLEISKTNHGVRPFTSVEENLFFRGLAGTFKFGSGRISVFYSQKKVDANVISGDTINPFFTSLQTTGYHRTQNEIDDKNAVQDKNAGAIFSWNFDYLKVGATFSYEQFNLPFIRSSQLYNQFRFRGSENFTSGFDYIYNKGRYQFFGEAAISKSKGKAFLQGAVIQLNEQLSFSALFRHFEKNYHAYWSNTFTEGGNTNNESGLFFGAQILPFKYISVSAYSDYYKANWIDYSTAAPADGWDVLAQANFTFPGKFEFYVRYKNEEKEQKFIKNERYVNSPKRLQKLRFHLQYNSSENLTFKTRIEHALYKGLEKENGVVIFQDVQFNPDKIPFSLSARLAWFNTESYNSRIYAYENDLLYTFSIPAYYGKGFRTYLNLKYKITGKIDFWFKIANTTWTDRETVGSGFNKIDGNNKTELKFQLRLKI